MIQTLPTPPTRVTILSGGAEYHPCGCIDVVDRRTGKMRPSVLCVNKRRVLGHYGPFDSRERT